MLINSLIYYLTIAFRSAVAEEAPAQAVLGQLVKVIFRIKNLFLIAAGILNQRARAIGHKGGAIEEQAGLLSGVGLAGLYAL